MLDLKQLDIRYVTNETGEKTAVILSIEEFQELLADLNDLAAAVEQLPENPYPVGVRKLVGSEHSYRLREGSHRIIYTVFSSSLTYRNHPCRAS